MFCRCLSRAKSVLTPFLQSTYPFVCLGDELGLFRTFWPRAAVTIDPPGPRPLLPGREKLALFRTLGIGLESWNDGIMEWWGHLALRKLGLFRTARLTLATSRSKLLSKSALFLRRSCNRQLTTAYRLLALFCDYHTDTSILCQVKSLAIEDHRRPLPNSGHTREARCPLSDLQA